MIKPIETVYNGYRFRSRLEARWAVFFDQLGIKNEYEKEGFDLGELGWYLPDFWLPESGWFIEVKGTTSDEKELKKARYLDDNPPTNEYGEIIASGCLIFGWPEIAIFKPATYSANGKLIYPPEFNDAYVHYQLITMDKNTLTVDDFNQAAIKARQARFEHGESPVMTGNQHE